MMKGVARALVVLVVVAVQSAGAFAQTRPAKPPDGAGGPAIAPLSSDIRWPTVEWIERRYKIEALRFKARDESGIDWPGSDEVMVETRDAKGWTVSNEFGNVDSGDTLQFDPARSCLVAVRPGVVVLGRTSVCDDVGEPAPLGFEVEFWEKDDLGWHPGFCNPLGPGPGGHAGPHCANDGNGDDLLGHARVEFAAQVLEAELPNVADQFVNTIALHPCPGMICAGWYLPDYSFTFRVTRMPDVRVDLRGVLDEAMRRSGARSELEAIVAGLRSLRAPGPSTTEPVTGDPPPRR